MSDTTITPLNPHLLQAYYVWMLENVTKIHLHCRADMIEDPFLRSYANENGILVLSIGPLAAQGFYIDMVHSTVGFSGTFGGRHRDVVIPLAAVRAIIGYPADRNEQPLIGVLPLMSETTTAPPNHRLYRKLRVTVSKDDAAERDYLNIWTTGGEGSQLKFDQAKKRPTLRVVKSETTPPPTTPQSDPTKPAKKRPTLRVVK